MLAMNYRGPFRIRAEESAITTLKISTDTGFLS